MKKIQWLALCVSILFAACSDNAEDKEPGTFKLVGEITDYGNVGMNAPSPDQEIQVQGLDLNQSVTIETTGDFEFAVESESYTNQLTLSAAQVNKAPSIKVRCRPTQQGELTGELIVTGEREGLKKIALKANGVAKLLRITTFDQQRLAFGGSYSQKAEGQFSFSTDPTQVENITMFVKLRCPEGGCNAWDMFANVRLQHPESGDWLEIGRYITPYGVDNSQLAKGFPIDVTDFKGLLTGEVNLQSFIEVWGQDGWLCSIDFEVTEGTPDYKYYAITPILDYAQNSLAGIPYGEANDFVVGKCITIPANTEETSFRTIISGWGHATPMDNDGRPCAEWCFRTHHVLIDDAPLFTHELKGIGCDRNVVSPQGGNWKPDRAGWCPGMEVPVRTDVFDVSMAAESFCYTYELEAWTNDFQANVDNKHAYYAFSSFVLVKSNTPIEAAVVE